MSITAIISEVMAADEHVISAEANYENAETVDATIADLGVGQESVDLLALTHEENRIAQIQISLEAIDAVLSSTKEHVGEESASMLTAALESFGSELDNEDMPVFPAQESFNEITRTTAVTYSSEGIKEWVMALWKRIVKVWTRIKTAITKWFDNNITAIGRMTKAAKEMVEKSKTLDGQPKEAKLSISNVEYIAGDKTGNKLTAIGKRNKDVIKKGEALFKIYKDKSIAAKVIAEAETAVKANSVDPAALSNEVLVYSNTLMNLIADAYGAKDIKNEVIGSWAARLAEWGRNARVEDLSQRGETSFEANGTLLPGSIKGTILGVDPIVFDLRPPAQFKETSGKNPKNLDVKVAALTPSEVHETFKYAVALGELVMDNKNVIREADSTLTLSTKAVQKLVKNVDDETNRNAANNIASVLRACTKNSTNVAYQAVRAYSLAARASYGYAMASYKNIAG